MDPLYRERRRGGVLRHREVECGGSPGRVPVDAAHSWNKHDIIARFMIFVHESGFCCMVHMYFHLGELGTIFYDSKVNLRMGSNGKSLDSQGIPSLT